MQGFTLSNASIIITKITGIRYRIRIDEHKRDQKKDHKNTMFQQNFETSSILKILKC